MDGPLSLVLKLQIAEAHDVPPWISNSLIHWHYYI